DYYGQRRSGLDPTLAREAWGSRAGGSVRQPRGAARGRHRRAQPTLVRAQHKHSAIPWMAATLDGVVEDAGAVFEAKFMLPWSFSEEAAAEKHMAQVQHNMWVTHLRTAVLSIITGGGKWVEITIPMDPLYLTVLVSAEKKFWRCVQSGETPRLMNAEPPRS